MGHQDSAQKVPQILVPNIQHGSPSRLDPAGSQGENMLIINKKGQYGFVVPVSSTQSNCGHSQNIQSSHCFLSSFKFFNKNAVCMWVRGANTA